MTTATNRAARRLLAPTFTQQCVTCQVNAGWPCTDRRGKPIRRIHIARVRAYFADLLRGAETTGDKQ